MTPREDMCLHWRKAIRRQAISGLMVVAFVLAGLPQAFAGSFRTLTATADASAPDSGADALATRIGSTPAVLAASLDSESFFAKRRLKGRIVNLAADVPDPAEPASLSAPDRVVTCRNEFGSEENLCATPLAHTYQALAPPAI